MRRKLTDETLDETSPTERELLAGLKDALEDAGLRVQARTEFGARRERLSMWADAVLTVRTPNARNLLVVECKRKVHPSSVPVLRERLLEVVKMSRAAAVGVVCAPRLSPAVRETLRKAGLGYFDASGNLYLRLHETTLWFDVREPGRRRLVETARDPFGKLPGVSRQRAALYRSLLSYPHKVWSVSALSQSAGVVMSATSKYLWELVDAGWVVRKARSEFILDDPFGLLDHWAMMSRRFARTERTFLLPAKSYDEFRLRVADAAKNLGAFHTMWSGAEFYGHFTDQPAVALYCENVQVVAETLGAMEAPSRSTANLWLLPFTDKSLGVGATTLGGENAVSPYQVYVDLARAPRRGASIAAMLREKLEDDWQKQT